MLEAKDMEKSWELEVQQFENYLESGLDGTATSKKFYLMDTNTQKLHEINKDNAEAVELLDENLKISEEISDTLIHMLNLWSTIQEEAASEGVDLSKVPSDKILMLIRVKLDEIENYAMQDSLKEVYGDLTRTRGFLRLIAFQQEHFPNT